MANDDKTNKTANETTNTTPAPLAPTPSTADAALAAHLERANALLVDLGPADALRVLGVMSTALANKARSEKGDDALAQTWAASSAGMEKLAASIAGGGAMPPVVDDGSDSEIEDEEPEEDEDDESDAPAAPRKERTKMRRMVAGMFDVSRRVESCRLREVNALGGLGDTVGFANDQGIEETEWPIAMMTPEHLKKLTARGGKFRFEWFGRRREDGARVGLGRSREFKAQGDQIKKLKKRKPEAPPAAAPSASTSEMGVLLQQVLAFQRQADERAEREKGRQHEIEKIREEAAAKERIERLRLEAEITKAKAATPTGPVGAMPFDAASLAAFIDQRIEESAPEEEDEEEQPSGGLPEWMAALGINREMLVGLAPIVQMLLAKHLGLGLSGPPGLLNGASGYGAGPGGSTEGE